MSFLTFFRQIRFRAGIGGVGVASVATLLLAGCATIPKSKPPPRAAPTPAPAHPSLPAPVEPPKPRTAAEMGAVAGPAIAQLGLTPDGARQALAAFRLSCPVLVKRVDRSGLTRTGDWQAACDDAMTRLNIDGPAFFARWFEAVRVGDGRAFATGYYEPEIEGSATHLSGFDTPVYRRPPDLVNADVVAGPDANPGRIRRGRRDGATGQLVLYYDRGEIDAGALAGRGLEIAWARDPIEFFFLQIQGSGRLIAPDGTVTRIGYDGQNGREYVGIGRLMRDRQLVGPDQLSMQGMMAWLRGHPAEGKALMEENKSFVFFKVLTGPGPLGALGVQVVGRASVAADPAFVPLGAPVFLTLDRAEASGLWVAQDTGGAIKGSNRFDTFWGAGVSARVTAGGMSGRGQALLLVPIGTLARLQAAGGLGVPGGGTTPAQR